MARIADCRKAYQAYTDFIEEGGSRVTAPAFDDLRPETQDAWRAVVDVVVKITRDRYPPAET